MRQFSRNGANRANADENDLFKEDSGREHLMITERQTVRCLHSRGRASSSATTLRIFPEQSIIMHLTISIFILNIAERSD